MITNEYGVVILTEDEIFNAIYSGKIKNFDHVFTDQHTAEKFNLCVDTNKDYFKKIEVYKDFDVDVKTFDKQNQEQWFMPKNYCDNLIEYLYEQCKTDEEKERVSKELELFIQYDMLNLLFYLKYLVDSMRENNIVWGVGRGSSVASYVLYLIGVHKINSLKYNLDIHEFLK